MSWFKFHLNVFLRDQHWFREWLRAEQTPSPYLNQWWCSPPTPPCTTAFRQMLAGGRKHRSASIGRRKIKGLRQSWPNSLVRSGMVSLPRHHHITTHWIFQSEPNQLWSVHRFCKYTQYWGIYWNETVQRHTTKNRMCNMLQLEYVIDIGNANKPGKTDFWGNSAIEMPMYMYPNRLYLSKCNSRF